MNSVESMKPVVLTCPECGNASWILTKLVPPTGTAEVSHRMAVAACDSCGWTAGGIVSVPKPKESAADVVKRETETPERNPFDDDAAGDPVDPVDEVDPDFVDEDTTDAEDHEEEPSYSPAEIETRGKIHDVLCRGWTLTGERLDKLVEAFLPYVEEHRRVMEEREGK